MNSRVKLVVANNGRADSASQGRLELFWVSNHGSVGHIYQTAVDNGWSASEWLASGHNMDHIGVGQNADGRLELFGVTGHGSATTYGKTNPMIVR
jgi:hypothetical protein